MDGTMLADRAELHSEAKTVQREIMKYFNRAANLFIFLLMLGIGTSSNASIITDTYDPNPDRLITTFNSPYTYTHDLRPQGVPGLTVNSATLDVYLYDITDLIFAFGEKVTFTFDHIQSSTVNNVSLFGQDYTFGVSTSMLADGLLSVSLSAGCSGRVLGHCVVPQDFVFARSVLTADVSDPVQNVPEPGSALCFALGLLMLGRVARRRNS
jgi:hypothetical protein